VNRNGHLEVNSVLELVAHLHANLFHVGCSAIDAISWQERAQAAEEDRRNRTIHRPEEWPPMVFLLHYANGVIDQRQSRVYTPMT
jgi:hypothetical protein